MRKELLKRDIVHCDETPVQVLKEEGKKPRPNLICDCTVVTMTRSHQSYSMITNPQEMVIMQQRTLRISKDMSILTVTPAITS